MNSIVVPRLVSRPRLVWMILCELVFGLIDGAFFRGGEDGG